MGGMGIDANRISWSQGYYYNFFRPFYKHTVFDGKSEDYALDLFKTYCGN